MSRKEIERKFINNNIDFKLCNEGNLHYNLYVDGEYVLSYYGTTGTIWCKYFNIDKQKYKGLRTCIEIYNNVFNNDFVKKLIRDRSTYYWKSQDVSYDCNHAMDIVQKKIINLYRCWFMPKKKLQSLVNEIEEIRNVWVR